MKKVLLLIPILVFFCSKAFTQNLQWVEKYSGSHYIYPYNMCSDNSGNIYTTGTFRDTTDFDPGIGTDTLIGIGQDIYIQKLKSNGQFVWARRIGGMGYDNGLAITTDQNNNVYVTGAFEDTVDFDPGAGVFNMMSTSYPTDIFILKLDSLGNFIWAKQMSGNDYDWARSITIDANGDVYITGEFEGTVDFDPGIGVYNLIATNTFLDMFVAKYTSSGNFVWAKHVSNGGNSRDMLIDNNQDVIITGGFSGTTDFDPGAGAYNITPFGPYTNAFVLKLDNSGNFLWAGGLGDGDDAQGFELALDTSNNIYICGKHTSSGDFDPTAGTTILTSSGGSNVFVVKLGFAGSFYWAKTFGGLGNEEAYGMCIDDTGNVSVCGSFLTTADFDPGAGNVSVAPVGTTEGYINTLDNNGNFVSVSTTSGTMDANYTDIIFHSGSTYGTGVFTGTKDFDPDTSTSTLTGYAYTDIFIQKLSNDSSCAGFSFQLTSVNNVSCSSNGEIHTSVSGGTFPYSYQWTTTPITYADSTIITTPGIYTGYLTDTNDCQRQVSAVVSGPSYFGSFDLESYLISTCFRPGFMTNLWLDGFNSGCTPASGQLILKIDTILNFIASTPPPDLISGDTLKWNFSSVNYDSPTLSPYIELYVPTYAVIGDSVELNLQITPLIGDINSTNNSHNYLKPIINGYDPNDKQVYPEGVCAAKYVITNDQLIYTVRFQNTGNSNAINIHVIDTLAADLDLNSIRVLSNSHPMIAEVLPGNILNFRFDNINLPDSNSNSIGSHGFVIFEITPNPSVINGTILENTANIYFDFNPAVITNTTMNTLIDLIPSCEVSVTNLEDPRYIVFPNPVDNVLHIASDFELDHVTFEIIDIHGKLLMRKENINGNHMEIDVSKLSSGLYFVSVYSANSRSNFKIIKN